LPEPEEASHAGQEPQTSVWFKWHATLSADVVFQTRNSQIATVAAVYSGPAENATHADLLPVASNVNGIGVNFSKVDFFAESGTTYYIAVDGLDGAQGLLNIVLGLPPANDDFANRIVLSG
jgi:hypothetical protein